ncbi:hypothetical protein KQH82_10795 [bacterium]|nr:hypothetical protein [bacterium]
MSDKTGLHEAFTQSLIDDLDSLITGMIDQIRNDAAKHAKIGDLIRMIELRYKLLPDHSSQKEFWKMMEKIRKEKLPSGKTAGDSRAADPAPKKVAS